MVNEFDPSETDEHQDQFTLKSKAFLTPVNMTEKDKLHLTLAKEIEKIMNESNKAMIELMKELKLQVNDPENTETYDENLRKFFNFNREAKRRFEESLGGEKTFIIKRTNVEYYNYIRELYELLNKRVLDNLKRLMATKKEKFYEEGIL